MGKAFSISRKFSVTTPNSQGHRLIHRDRVTAFSTRFCSALALKRLGPPHSTPLSLAALATESVSVASWSRHVTLRCAVMGRPIRWIKVHVLVVYVPFVANAMCGDDVDRDPSHLPAPSWLNRRWPSPVAQCVCAPTVVEKDSPRHGRQERLRCESIHPSNYPSIIHTHALPVINQPTIQHTQ